MTGSLTRSTRTNTSEIACVPPAFLYDPRPWFRPMRTTASTALDASLDLDALQAVLQEHPVQLAILFGSHATETTHPRSDIDLAVEFDAHRPSDSSYNDVFLGLSADLSDALETDDVDLVDLPAVSPALATAIFENGVHLVGEQAHATELRRQLTAAESEPSVAMTTVSNMSEQRRPWVINHARRGVVSGPVRRAGGWSRPLWPAGGRTSVGF